MSRTAKISRQTNETDIHVELNVDGTGLAKISTGIGFFDHMLELLTRHSAIDLTIQAKGDLQVDQHHTVEDVGICLGQAFKQALGDKAGIRRYGHFSLPMEETLATIAIDLSGRAFLVFAADLPTAQIGTFDSQLMKISGKRSLPTCSATYISSCITAATAITLAKRSSKAPPAPYAWRWKRTHA